MTKKCFLPFAGLVCALAVLSSCGGGSTSSPDAPTNPSNPPPVSTITPQGKVELIAGNIGGRGYIDDLGAAARLFAPTDVAVDSSGNMYFTEYALSSVRKISPLGAVSTMAGAPGSIGQVDGQGTAAKFNYPIGIAIDRQGNVFVGDAGNRTIRKISSTGMVSTFAGKWVAPATPGVSPLPVDGSGANARFQYLGAMTIDASDNLFAVDGKSIRMITPNASVTTYAQITDGSEPVSLAVDSVRNLFVVTRRVTFCIERSCRYVYAVLKIAANGTITTLVGANGVGMKDGPGASAQFGTLHGIAVDTAGNVFVADSSNVDPAGNFTENHSIRKISASGEVTTWAGTSVGIGASVDGVAASARFTKPGGMAIDKTGNLYVADDNVMRKITSDARVTTLAGAEAVAEHRDGIGAAAGFDGPVGGIASDSSGNLFVTEARFLRKISPTGDVTTLAGTLGMVGSVDGNGTTASFTGLHGSTTDSAGNIFVLDGNAVRRISATGVVTTVAGSVAYGGVSKDGTGSAAQFLWPGGLVSHPSGDLYLSDDGGVRKITPAGVVTTLQGTAPGTGVSIDGAGNLYLFLSIQSPGTAIRRITPTGETRDFTVDLNFTNCGAMQPFTKTNEADVLYFVCNKYDSATNSYLSASLYRLSPTGVLTEIVKSSGLIGIQLGDLPKASTGMVRGMVALDAKSFAFISENGVLKLTPP